MGVPCPPPLDCGVWGGGAVLRLSEECYLAETVGGTYLLTGRGLLRLDAEVPRAVVAHVLGALREGASWEQATTCLAREQQPWIPVLVRLLRDHGALVSAHEPGTRWGRPRAPVVLIVGAGVMASALAAAFRESGVVEVRVVPAAAGPDGADIAVQVLGSGCQQQLRLERTCAADGVPLWQVVSGEIGGWLRVAGGAHGGLDDVLRRVAALGGHVGDNGGGPEMTGEQTFAAILARQVVQDVVARGPGADSHDLVRIVDRRSLRTSRHRVLPHPFGRVARQRDEKSLHAQLAELAAQPSLTVEELEERFERLCDDRGGVVSGFDDLVASQLPLRVRAVRVSDPIGLLAGERLTAIGVGADAATSRSQARLRALEAYGSVMLDPRLLVDRDGAFISGPDGDAMRLLSAVRCGMVEAFVRGADLVRGATRLIPAPVAFPVLRVPRGAFLVPSGTAAGFGWDHALVEALRQECRRLTVEGPLRRRGAPRDLHPSRFGDDPATRFGLDMLRAAGLRPTLHDVSGPLAVPVVACRYGTARPAYGCGPDMTQAVREALTAALLDYQARADPGLAAMFMSTAGLTPADAGSLTAARLAAALDDVGYPPTVIALDHDPVVYDQIPFVLRIVLGHADA